MSVAASRRTPGDSLRARVFWADTTNAGPSDIWSVGIDGSDAHRVLSRPNTVTSLVFVNGALAWIELDSGRTSFAVVGYFRQRPEAGLSAWSSKIAPTLAGILLVVILVLGVANFNVLITSATGAPTDTMTVVLPLILLVGGILGLVVGAWLKRNKPEIYAGIGEGRE